MEMVGVNFFQLFAPPIDGVANLYREGAEAVLVNATTVSFRSEPVQSDFFGCKRMTPPQALIAALRGGVRTARPVRDGDRCIPMVAKYYDRNGECARVDALASEQHLLA